MPVEVARFGVWVEWRCRAARREPDDRTWHHCRAQGKRGSIFWSDTDFFVIDTAYFVSSRLPLRFLYFDLQRKNFINGDARFRG